MPGSVLTTAEIHRLRRTPKTLDPDWAVNLLASATLDGPNMRAKRRLIDLPEVDGSAVRLWVYVRWAVSAVDDFSAGVYMEWSDGGTMRLMRCNGPHIQPHTNRWPRRTTFLVTPHVHHLTEHYQREALRRPGQVEADGFAIPTRLYHDALGALQTLGRKVTISTQGRLW